MKISKIYNLSNDTRSMEIKSEKQLANLTQSVKLTSKKFDKFQKDRKEKEKIINGLKQEVNGPKKELNH